MKPVRGRCFPWDLKEFPTRHYVAVVDDTRADKDDIPVLILPIEGDNVGGLEPWMVGYLGIVMKDLQKVNAVPPGALPGVSKIATAIEEILKEAEG